MLQVVKDNPWIECYAPKLQQRHDNYLNAKKRIESIAGSITKFADSYQEYGIHKVDEGILYKEWAPNAEHLYLVGDFDDWGHGKNVYEATRDEFGTFTLFIKDTENGPVIPHNTRVKCKLITKGGETLWRIPAWINYAVQDPTSKKYDGVFWNPEEKYEFKYDSPKRKESLLIYEVHIGMAGVEPRIHTYREFADNIIPRVVELGYNTIQVMAIMEHPYYASFGYQVTNFFAPSSRFGTPDDLKYMIDIAHKNNITVLLDLVHSHACKNVEEGLNFFDGTDHQYFHSGGRGYHDLWDSRLFNYNHIEVQRFLLSNLRYYMQEYRFDGFRFDGVTSIMYLHHGNLYSFTSGDDYFNSLVDEEAITYLMLANDLIHETNPYAITIAEEVSGMIGLARSLQDGGIGFDYRLGMATPDMWIKTLKELTDEQWKMGDITFTLSNRPYKEKTVAYCESHDQALVGDKTIAFWLMDKEMYTHMSNLSPQSAIIDRGIALHKMIRLITFSLGGEAYLTFMGNEFGHPEWIDFPREGNGNSFLHCCRRFDLPKDHLLKYQYLENFDKAMLQLEAQNHFINSGDNGYVTLKNEVDKIIAFERGGMLFVFNFHTNLSFPDYFIGIEYEGKYKIVLNSDDPQFGGFNRLDPNVEYYTKPEPMHNRKNRIQLYIPCRCAFVLKKVD